MAALDHLVWAAPDLDQAVARLRSLTGCPVQPGGAHPGNGTRNALLGLGERTYVEVLAPDPAQNTAAAAMNMKALRAPALHTFAVASPRLDQVGKRLEKAGLPHAGIIPMSRRLPTGQLVRWRLLMPTGHAYGPLVPFFIDWGDSPHPADGLPSACRLAGLQITHPEAWSLRVLMEKLEIEVQVDAGPASLSAELETPRGRVTLSSMDAVHAQEG